jgi:hypothetical protein
VPYLLVLAILKVLDDETLLPNYLRDVVYEKLKTQVDKVTLEELLLLRLTCIVAQ